MSKQKKQIEPLYIFVNNKGNEVPPEDIKKKVKYYIKYNPNFK